MRRSRDELNNRRWVKIFIAIAVLVVAQVIWWTAVFMRNVSTTALIKTENSALTAKLSGTPLRPQTALEIEKEAFHRRVMFLSESISFVLLTCFGMYLLFHALRVEERARKTQRNFIEIVSHESKTPLTALKLRLESVVDKRREDGPLGKELALAMEEVRRLSSLFDKALSLNRVETMAFRLETLYLADTVREVVRRMEPLFRAKNVKLNLEVDPEAVVQGDAHALENLVQSLAENAVLYNNHLDKELSISVQARDTKVRLTIADNGPGISPDDRPRLFERFYRGASSRSIPGTGLGLYLAKIIVETHLGQIRVTNGERGGTSFEIEFPGGVKA